MTMNVGFIGLGIMGLPMARNVMKAGFPLTVYNRTLSKAEQLAREGAQVAASRHSRMIFFEGTFLLNILTLLLDLITSRRSIVSSFTTTPSFV